MSKRSAKEGVGQLVLQIVFPPGETNDGTGETEENRQSASGASPAVRSKPERKRKWYSLSDKVYALPNLEQAWQRVAANQGAPGIDGLTIEQFREKAAERLAQLAADLRQKSYRPQPVRRGVLSQSGEGGGEPPPGRSPPPG